MLPKDSICLFDLLLAFFPLLIVTAGLITKISQWLHFIVLLPFALWNPNKCRGERQRRNVSYLVLFSEKWQCASPSALSQLVTFEPPPPPALWKLTWSAPLQREAVLLVHPTDCLLWSPEWTQGCKRSASRMSSQTDLRLLKHNHSSFIRMWLDNNGALLQKRERFVYEDSLLTRSGDF